jgi:hypothetical protein
MYKYSMLHPPPPIPGTPEESVPSRELAFSTDDDLSFTVFFWPFQLIQKVEQIKKIYIF